MKYTYIDLLEQNGDNANVCTTKKHAGDVHVAYIDVTADELLTLPEAASEFQTRGRRPSTTSVWRWCRKGIHGVHLEYVRVGRAIYTTRESIRRFARDLVEADQALNPQHSIRSTLPPARNARQCQQAAEHAQHELEQDGA